MSEKAMKAVQLNRMARSLVLLVAGALSACAGRQAFSTSYPANRPDELRAVLARAKASPRAAARPVVVGVTAEPKGVFAYDLQNQALLFNVQAPVTGVPVAAGELVVVQEAAHVRVRKLAGGSVVLELPSEGMHLIGADSDGRITAIVLSTGGSMGARSRLVILDGEHVASDLRVPRPLGGPAVLGGLVFVPNNRVHLSVVDATGGELARVAIREDVASQAFVFDGDVYFGLAGAYRLDESTPRGASGGATYFKPKREDKLPGQPAFLPNTTDPPPAVDSAVHRVSLSWLPGLQGETLGLRDDSLYLLFYRQLYALNPNLPQVHWVYQTASDAVGIKAVPDGVIVVDDTGGVTALDTQGRPRFTASLGVKPVVASIRADRFDQGSAASEASPLAIQLVDAARNPDTRLVPARAMAVSMLAALEDEDATNALIEICQDRAGPARVRKVACVALGKRTTGSEAVIAALERHANYLTETKPPPVGPLSEAALRNGDARAVPALLSQLADPQTPVEELPALMLALQGLADASAAGPISDFLRLYHAEADEEHLADALVIAVETLAKIQGASAQGVLEPIANDALGATSVRGAASRMLASLAPPSEESGEKPAEVAKPSEPEPVDPGPPEHLTAVHTEKALAPVRAKLTQCVRSDPKRPASARVTIVVSGDGEVLTVQTLPVTLNACVEPLVRTTTFPANKFARRETVTYTLTR